MSYSLQSLLILSQYNMYSVLYDSVCKLVYLNGLLSCEDLYFVRTFLGVGYHSSNCSVYVNLLSTK